MQRKVDQRFLDPLADCLSGNACRALTKAQLPATCILSEGVRARHDCFYMCSNEECQKIYWQVCPLHCIS